MENKTIKNYTPKKFPAVFLIAIPLVVAFFLFWYYPALGIYAELKLAPYFGDWYAFYLDNNLTFYAQITGSTKDLLKLSDVYYVQTVKIGEQPTSSIIRRGPNEITLPENYLLMNRNKILYYEKIGKDSQVMKIILQNQNQ